MIKPHLKGRETFKIKEMKKKKLIFLTFDLTEESGRKTPLLPPRRFLRYAFSVSQNVRNRLRRHRSFKTQNNCRSLTRRKKRVKMKRLARRANHSSEMMGRIRHRLKRLLLSGPFSVWKEEEKTNGFPKRQYQKNIF